MTKHELYHVPVLRDELIDMMITRNDGVYLDCTLGGGGHFRALAEKLGPGAVLIGIDRDPDAIAWNIKHPVSGEQKVIIEQCRFSQFDIVLKKIGIKFVDGVLLDLGLSSFQIDNPERGFSYMHESDLDMRMNSGEGLTAGELLERSSEAELASILSQFGEVINPLRMARTIKSCVPLNSSSDLRDCLSREYGPNIKFKVLAKIFQALRIAVNDELGELKRFLDQVPGYLAAGGRLAVISYHSLEDRMVKEFIREKERGCTCPADVPVCICGKPVLLKRITRKAVKATEDR